MESSRVVSIHEQGAGHSVNGHALKMSPPESDETKIRLVSEHFAEIMKIIGIDLDEDGVRDTPRRVARMYVKELFSGLNPSGKPSVTLLKNPGSYNKLVIEKNITLHSICEHHFLPIVGKAHVAYISNGNIIGLSKLDRIVHYHARKPQLQERLTDEIATALKEALRTQDVAVLIDAVHLSVSMRGLHDTNSSTITSYFGGKFQRDDIKTEFLLAVK